MDELDDILNGNEAPKEPETPAVEPVAEVAQPKAETAARDEKGRFVQKGEQQAEPVAAPPAAEEKTVPTKALQEERRKRQELEQRLAEIEARQQPQQPPPSVWEDERGAFQHFGQEVVGTAVQQATFNARLDMSEMMVRQAHADDFDEKKATFMQLMAEVPGLQQRALQDPHPWNFAYQYVTNHERMNELAAVNVGDLEAKIEARIRAELTAQPIAPLPAVPTSLADAQSAKPSGSDPAPRLSLDDILGRKA